MDEAAQIDLALNTDFDPSLFDCWDEPTTKADDNPCKESADVNHGLCGDDNKITLISTSSEGLVTALVKQEALPQSQKEWSSENCRATDFPYGCSSERDSLSQSRISLNLQTESNGQVQSLLPKDDSIATDQPQLHPLGIPASANCPPQNQRQLNQAHDFSLQMNPYQSNQIHYHQNHACSSSLGENGYTQNTQLPTAYSTTMAARGSSYQNPLSYFLSQNPQHNQQASVVSGSSGSQTYSSQSHHKHEMNSSVSKSSDKFHRNSRGHGAVSATVSLCQTTNTSSSTSTRNQMESNSGSQNPFLLQQSVENGRDEPKPAVMATPNPRDLPPFLLFDAPIELRANFIQSQRQRGIPTMEDNNSLHYGMVVNGFHPQHRQVLDPANVPSRGPVSTATLAEQVRLIDGRHGDVGNKRVKNAREQKRTQKITDLIDELRVKMERGGWKVGLKSKFHTLSSCAEYVKHLVQVNIEKEDALKKARADFEAKNKSIEEDDKAQQDPSDPESTTSSLTASTSSAGQRPAPKKKGNSDDHSTRESCIINNGKKREKSSSSHRSKENSGTTHMNHNTTGTDSISVAQPPKPVLSSHESSLSSATSSWGEASGQLDRIPGMSFTHKMLASVSDITDSNKGSSSEGNSSSSDGCRGEGNFDSRETGSVGGTGSVSSDAAVARGQDNHGHDTCHADVVVTKLRKRKNTSISSDDPSRSSSDEPTSLEARFLLDYEEVFLKSNVPQILATTSGRIIAWNEFFLKITGLKADEVERLTIFSLVQASRLSSLFEIVAASLRSGTAQSPNDFRPKSATLLSGNGVNFNGEVADHVQEQAASSDETDASPKISNYCALTLPCVSFNPENYSLPIAHNKSRHSNKNSDENQDTHFTAANGQPTKNSVSQPLYMTITLMTDKDPRKRCFHCVFTDSPGTNGNLGSVTPELLSTLFTKQNMILNEPRNANRKRCNRRSD